MARDLCKGSGLYKPYPSSLTSDNYVEQTKGIRRGKHGSFVRYFDLLHGQVLRKRGMSVKISYTHPIHGALNYFKGLYPVSKKFDVNPYTYDSADISGLNLYFMGQNPFSGSKGQHGQVSFADNVVINYHGASATVSPNIGSSIWLQNEQVATLCVFAHPSHRYYGRYAIVYKYTEQWEVYTETYGDNQAQKLAKRMVSSAYHFKIYEQVQGDDGTLTPKYIGETSQSGEMVAFGGEVTRTLVKAPYKEWGTLHNVWRYEGDGIGIYDITPKNGKFISVVRTADGRNLKVIDLYVHNSYTVENMQYVPVKSAYLVLDDGELLEVASNKLLMGYQQANTMPVVMLCEWLTLWQDYHAVSAFDNPPPEKSKKWYQHGLAKGIFTIAVMAIVVVVSVSSYFTASGPAAKAGGSIIGGMSKIGAAAFAASMASITLTVFSIIAQNLGMKSVASFLSILAKGAGVVSAVLGVYAVAQNFIQQGAQQAISASALAPSSASNMSSMPLTTSLYTQPSFVPMTSSMYASGLGSSTQLSTLSTTQLSTMGLSNTWGVGSSAFNGLGSLTTSQLSTAVSASNAGSMMSQLKSAFTLGKKVYDTFSMGKELFKSPNDVSEPDMPPKEEEQEASRVNWGLTWSGTTHANKFINTKEVYDLGDQEGTLLYTPSVKNLYKPIWIDDRAQEIAIEFFKFDFDKKDKK